MKLFGYVIITLLLFSACGKKDGATPSSNNSTGGNNNTGGNTTTGNTCNVQLADAENIAIFPADNAWNQDISNAAIDPYNTQIIAQLGTSKLKADFGSGLYDGVPIGIPYDVVCGSQPKVAVTFRANSYDGNYGDESDQ